MAKKMTDAVTWVGKVDWDIREFEGGEYYTDKGTSYNAYLVRDERTALIDTVWTPFAEEFVEQLRQTVDLNTIDYIVINHGEPDHSGALPALLREIPGTPIYCTLNGVSSLRGQYHEDWNFVPVRTGDTLPLGRNTLQFIEAPLMHWPDTMFTYMSGENLLFPNDAFGQHYATEALYNDLVDPGELYAEAIKYYANILTPFSPLVTSKINQILGMNLQLNMICPSHGVIWRQDPMQIVNAYLRWADSYQENQITLIYDTMWGSTRLMAEAIARGIQGSDSTVTVKLMNSFVNNKNDIIAEVFRSKTILLGSPTINNVYLYSIGGLLVMMRGLRFTGKSAAAFGSYGWSGEAVRQISDGLQDAGFSLVNEGLRILWVPDEAGLAQSVAYGAALPADGARETPPRMQPARQAVPPAEEAPQETQPVMRTWG
jgi:anaerobic nitric oxide reductase flavorubredoxin